MRKRVHILYHGFVQGVGFRFTAQHLANKLGVKGWVKNLSNGSVEIVAEEEEKVLEDFLSQIKGHFCRYIHNADVKWQEPKRDFEDFQIRF